ncbi:MAG: hypothetical protein ACRBCT_07775 [Alphaproteobacteria bacterium]
MDTIYSRNFAFRRWRATLGRDVNSVQLGVIKLHCAVSTDTAGSPHGVRYD